MCIRDRAGWSLTVHSLGSQPVTGGRAWLEDARGRPLAEVALPPLEAPRDLRPRTATVRLPAHPQAAGVRVALAGEEAEITTHNNRLSLP